MKIISILPKKEQKNHETRYDIYLENKTIQEYTDWNDIVYDSFIGTGTTAVACTLLNNLNYIGSELSAEQCSFAESRIIQL